MNLGAERALPELHSNLAPYKKQLKKDFFDFILSRIIALKILYQNIKKLIKVFNVNGLNF